MLRHSLLIIYRNIKRNKSTFFINLIGLSTGLACALLIYLWVNDELNMDKFNEKDSQLYQVMQNYKYPEGIKTLEWTPVPLAKTLTEEMPEVEYSVSVFPPAGYLLEGIISNKEINFKASAKFASKDFFNVFTYHLIQGNKNQVLKDKNSIVISDELALKLFHTTGNIIGKSIKWSQQGTVSQFVISGAFKKVPSNATIKFDILFNYDSYKENHPEMDSWTYNAPSTYIILKEHTKINQFTHKIENLIKIENSNAKGTLFLRKYSDQYLYSQYENGMPSGGRITYVRLFSIVAVFILLIACINFMNLSTAKASGKMKEIGIKKTVGAARKELVLQYLSESLIMSFLSLLVAAVVIELLLPQFNEITGKHLAFNFNTNIILVVLVITFFTGILSGSYPALYLSGFNPAVILKGKFNTSVSELFTRKGLVIFQFTISVILIFSTFVVYKQIEFIQSKNLGYNKDNIIHFDSDIIVNQNREIFLNNLNNIPGVVKVSGMDDDLLNSEHNNTTGLDWEGKNPDNRIEFADLGFVNYDFFEILNIKMKDGRTFSKNFPSDTSGIIFNESAINIMGLKNPVGKTVKLWGKDMKVIGVAKDFNFESLYQPLRPCFLRLSPVACRSILVKIKAGTEVETINRLRKFYSENNLGLPFAFKFLDDDYQAFYESDIRVALISKYFAGIAIIVSCLGLFGLAAFTAERRRKEIGIRKVLGSSDIRIIYLLSSDYTKLVIAAIVVALPVAYLITKYWLDSFVYRINLEPWYFIAAGLSALLITLLTIGAQAIKAATANPIKSLKYE